MLRHYDTNPIKLNLYDTKVVAEVIGIELFGFDIIDCYTPDSRRAMILLEAVRQYHLDNPTRPKLYVGDFNIHNPGWVHSTSKGDAAGTMAQEFCEMFGFNQLIDFPTRGLNTPDLIMTPFQRSASPLPGLGSSDNVSVSFNVNVQCELPEPPADSEH